MRSYPAESIRNVAIIGHSSTGKTSVVESILFATGSITRLGKVEDGTTVSDFDPDEIKHHMSINLSVIPVEYQNTKINFIDTPGYADFIGEIYSALRVADSALVVISAEKGVEVGTDITWKVADEYRLPRLIFINKLDRENTSFTEAVKSLRDHFGTLIVPLQIPIGQNGSLSGVVDLVTQKSHRYEGNKVVSEQIPSDLVGMADQAREHLIETAADCDDVLMSKYLNGEKLSIEEIHAAIRIGVRERKIIPVFCGSAAKMIGIQDLLNALLLYAPSSNEIPELPSLNQEKIAALVFKTFADPHKGQINYFRVYQGSIKSDSHIYNLSTNADERISQLLQTKGKQQDVAPEITIGDIGAAVKLQNTHTGNTFTAPGGKFTLPGINFPHASYTATIKPKTKADLDKMSSSLNRIIEEDPTIHLSRDQNSAETHISGMGESHLAIAIERLQHKFGVAVELSEPLIPYRETIRKHARAQGRHKRQSGGHGQFGDVWLELDPIPINGPEFEFQNLIVGGVVPKEYIPSVEKGSREALRQGVLAGYPMINVKVKLVDGSYHPVDSSGQAFEIAASLGIKNALSQASPTLLEPIMSVTIDIPDSSMGDIISDLNTRRARVLGMEPIENGLQRISANVPMAEMLHYATDLRSITQGHGTFSMELLDYEEVPQQVQQTIIEKAHNKQKVEA